MIRVYVSNGHPRYRVRHAQIKRYVTRTLRDGRQGRATVGVVFLDSRAMRTLNRRYLRHDRTTDVISFRLESGANLEGEVYVNLDRARTQSREYEVSFANEVARLVIHGTLHLLGYDDRTNRLRSVMKREEDRQLRHWFHQELDGR
jgi:probable rRNA maturation factor